MLATKSLLVADECWVALAHLHRENPARKSFSAREILDRVGKDAPETVRAGVQAHIYLHNVANVAPNSAKYRMFYRLEDGSYRLFRPGDDHHPERRGKSKPDASDLPEEHHELLAWYEQAYCASRGPGEPAADPILQMLGVGRELWAKEGGDAYVARQRRGWDEPHVRGGRKKK